jgi:choline dehydrogenase-like flavoprotein
MTAEFDVCVVGTGAGGGLIAGELTRRGRRVAIVETGHFWTTKDFSRFELDMYRKLWWPWRSTSNRELGYDDEIYFAQGRCVGGSTTIFTAVAHRPPASNFDDWHRETDVVSRDGTPFTHADIQPYYDLVERQTSVRPYTELDSGTLRVQRGFEKIGLNLFPSNSYVNTDCDKSGCLFGCPTEAKRGTMITYVIPAVLLGAQMFYDSTATRVLLKRTEEGVVCEGVEIVDPNGDRQQLKAKVTVLAAGSLNTPQILMKSNLEEYVGSSQSITQIGRNLGVDTAKMVYGKFDEILDNYVVKPLPAHCLDLVPDGVLFEASSIMEGPLGFAQVLVDDGNKPLWGDRHKQIMKNYRYYAGIFLNTRDHNNGWIELDETGDGKFYKPIIPEDRKIMDRARSVAREALEAAGATDIVESVYLSAHMQGTCRMGEIKSKSVVNSNGEMHDVNRLFVGDASVIPKVIDANPSLTIMALASRLVDYLSEDPAGYLT